MKTSSFDSDFTTLNDVVKTIEEEHLDLSDYIIGIDYSVNNTSMGNSSFSGKSLHNCKVTAAGRAILNPYQQVFKVLDSIIIPKQSKVLKLYGIGMYNFVHIIFY